MFKRKVKPPSATTVQDKQSSLIAYLPNQQPSGPIPDGAFINSPAGDRLQSTGRFQTASGVGGYGFTRSVGDRHYDVQAFTGYSMGTVPGTQWNRGYLYRAHTPMLRVPNEVAMVDPTKPESWHSNPY